MVERGSRVAGPDGTQGEVLESSHAVFATVQWDTGVVTDYPRELLAEVPPSKGGPLHGRRTSATLDDNTLVAPPVRVAGGAHACALPADCAVCERFKCSACGETKHWDEGGADDSPGVCDDCWVALDHFDAAARRLGSTPDRGVPLSTLHDTLDQDPRLADPRKTARSRPGPRRLASRFGASR